MFEIIRLIFSVLLAVLIGWSLLTIIFYKRPCLYLFEKLALSYPLGIGLITLGMAVMSISGRVFNPVSILIWWSPLVLAGLTLSFKNRGDLKRAGFGREKACLSNLEKFFVLAISFQVLYIFFRALIMPIEAYDAIAIYALKAKIFYMAKAIPLDFFSRFKDFVPHIEYPLLVPLSETYHFIFLGTLNDILVKVIFPLFYLATLIVFYHVLLRYLNRRGALLFTFLLATVPQFAEYATNAYADMVFAFYYSSGLFYLYLWMREKQAPYLIVSFLFALLSMWTKTEGFMLIGVNITAAAIYTFKARGALSRQGALYIFAGCAAILVYLSVKKVLGLALHGDFSSMPARGFRNAFSYAKRTFLVLYEYQRQFFGPKKWNIAWILFLWAFSTNFKKAFSDNLRPLTLAIILTLAGYGAVYLITPQDISWHLSTTASRFFIHFLPITVLWLAIIYKEKGLEI